MESAIKANLVVTNTLFYHKLGHRVTWVNSEKNKLAKDGHPRKNPIRNQIDFILIHNRYRNLITNSRSYSGINTVGDHRLVVATFRTDWKKIKSNKASFQRLDVNALQNEENATKYKESLAARLSESRLSENNPHEKWEEY